MPNHITNKFIISGNDNLVRQVIGPYDDETYGANSNNNEQCTLTFKRTVPHPPESDNDENWDWYTWNCDNWGTKWDAYEVRVVSAQNIGEENEVSVELEFQTAWSPPDMWLNKTVIQYPTLDFKLFWVDEDYPSSGKFFISNGNFMYQNYGHSDEAKEFVKEHWPELYESYEEYQRIDNLQTELDECVKEFFPNISIEITDYEEVDGLDEPKTIEIKCYLQHQIITEQTQSNYDAFNHLDNTLRKEIIKKVKEIVLEHGYKTKSKGKVLTITKKI
jgi:hypothetical protein